MASARAPTTQVTCTFKDQQLNSLVRNEVFGKVVENFIDSGKGQLKIMVVGEAGQGKSTLINGLIGAGAEEGHSLTAGTSEVKEYCKEQNGITIRIWDIPGFGLGKKEDDDIRIEQELKSSGCHPLDLLLFCLRMDQQRVPTRVHEDTIQKLTEVFGDEIWHHAMFVLTFANMCEAMCPEEVEVEEYFSQRQLLIEKELYTTLRQHSGLTKEQVQCVRVVPVGNYKKSGQCKNQWALPDRQDWYLNFWLECSDCMDMEGLAKIIRANRHRLQTEPEPEDIIQQHLNPQDRTLMVTDTEMQVANIQQNTANPSFEDQLIQEITVNHQDGIQDNADGNLAEAMAKGAGDLRLSNIVFHGPPGAGKTSVKNLILGHPPCSRHAQNATDILEKCVRTVSVSRIATAKATPSGKQHFEETSNDDIIIRLAGEVGIFINTRHNGMLIKKAKDESPSTMVTGSKRSIATQSQITRDLSDSVTFDNIVHNLQPSVESHSSGNVGKSGQPIPTATHSTNSHTHIPTTIETWQEMKQRLQRIDPSKLPNLFDSRWFHHIDSGGQPQFLDVFPLLYLSPYSHFIVVMRLTEGLDERPKVRFYNKGNDEYTLPDHLVLSNREMIIRMCQIAQRVGRATQGKFTPKVIVVGTHQDNLLPLIGRFQQWNINSQMLQIHKKYSDVLVCKVPEEQVMFTVNAMAKDGSEERQRYTEELQECILSATENSDNAFRVPLKWLLFHLELDRGERSVYRISECLELGEKLEMTKEEVSSALEFLNKAALILYYPDNVPDLVLTKVEPLTTRLSKLIKASFIPLANEPTKECDDLREKGVFKKSFLAKVFRDVQQRAEISNDEFLALLVCLKIAVNIGDEYFLPSALSLEPLSTQSEFRSKSNSLALIWDDLILPHGFFLTVSVELQDKSAAQSEGGYVFTLCRGNPQWKGEIQLSEAKGRIPGIVKLRDRQQWIEVSYSGDNSYCPIVNRLVNSATQRAIKRLRHTGITSPTIGCVCPLCFREDHYATIADDGRFITCSKDEHKTGRLTENISCWFKGIRSNTKTTAKEDDLFNQVSALDVLTSHTPRIMGVVSDTDILIATLASVCILSSDDVISITTGTGCLERAEKIMDAVKTCLTRSSNPEEVLLKFSNVLMGQREEGLKDISVEIRGYLILNKPPELCDVYTVLDSKASQWNEIGRRLGVSNDYRSQLRQEGIMSNSDRKLEGVLVKWIESRCSEVTWRTVFKVLRKLQFNDVLESAMKFLRKEDILNKYLILEQ